MTTIVLLPGMDGSGALFGDFIAALGLNPVIVAYPPDTPQTYDELEHFVHQSLPAGEPYILLGESFSGPVAIRIASRKPAGLKALVLVCTFAALPPSRSGACRFPSRRPRCSVVTNVCRFASAYWMRPQR